MKFQFVTLLLLGGVAKVPCALG